ncbi:hypothetical protein RHGRI_013974 [Rhododendron griersonianum]|uniref:Nucleic acid binding NABP domain-containing protein n=1 Tax=Rhododendron griersonianum TaxID=479676 RepID=A0AAV6K7M0_9ERIC|nr:hypothetical protein RHGRI_013974 [Rhododendron griersonianum]
MLRSSIHKRTNLNLGIFTSFAEQSAKTSYPDLHTSNGALHRTTASSNKSYMKGSSTSMLNSKGSLSSHYQHMDATNSSFLNYGLGEYSVNTGTSNTPPLFEIGAAASPMASPGMDSRMLGGGLPFGSNVNPGASESPHFNRIGTRWDHWWIPCIFKFCAITSEIAIWRSHWHKSGGSNHHGYYGTPAYGVGLSYPRSPLASLVIPNSPVGLNMQYPTGIRNLGGGVMGPWHLQTGSNVEDSFA